MSKSCKKHVFHHVIGIDFPFFPAIPYFSSGMNMISPVMEEGETDEMNGDGMKRDVYVNIFSRNKNEERCWNKSSMIGFIIHAFYAHIFN